MLDYRYEPECSHAEGHNAYVALDGDYRNMDMPGQQFYSLDLPEEEARPCDCCEEALGLAASVYADAPTLADATIALCERCTYVEPAEDALYG